MIRTLRPTCRFLVQKHIRTARTCKRRGTREDRTEIDGKLNSLEHRYVSKLVSKTRYKRTVKFWIVHVTLIYMLIRNKCHGDKNTGFVWYVTF